MQEPTLCLGLSAPVFLGAIFAYSNQARFQTLPKPDDCDPTLAQGLQREGIYVAFCDGSVRLIGDHASSRSWYLLCDPSDGQVLPNDVN